MRRSAAPSQTSCGVPLAKRPRFHTPFAAKDGEGCSSDQSVAVDTCTSLESRHIDEEYVGSTIILTVCIREYLKNSQAC